MSRFFSFGCSYTSWSYPTWADYIGLNFQEYYNLAIPGGSNVLMFYKFMAALDEFKLNSDTDYVAVMLTTHSRYSFLKKSEQNNLEWTTNGDVVSEHAKNHELYPKYKSLIENLWSPEFSIIQSYYSALAIKEILTDKKIPHKILLAMKDEEVESQIDNDEIKKIADNFAKIIDFPSMLSFQKEMGNDYVYWIDKEGNVVGDSHPNIDTHYQYFKKYFSSFDNEKTENFYLLNKDIFVRDKQFQDQQYKKIIMSKGWAVGKINEII